MLNKCTDPRSGAHGLHSALQAAVIGLGQGAQAHHCLVRHLKHGVNLLQRVQIQEVLREPIEPLAQRPEAQWRAELPEAQDGSGFSS